jgi:hypothetical protein
VRSRVPKKVSLNLLRELEPAIHNIEWRQLKEMDKEELKKRVRRKDHRRLNPKAVTKTGFG